MKVIVLTGSTRGIGFGMAREFLKRGHNVVVCGRSQKSTLQAIDALGQEFSAEQVSGKPCDVSVPEQVEQLWKHAVQQFGQVDYWINNAGLGAPREEDLVQELQELSAYHEGCLNTDLIYPRFD